MQRYSDIDPQDLDPETGEPYSNYSTPALDTSFHDHEMGGELETRRPQISPRDLGATMCAAGIAIDRCPFDDRDEREEWRSGWREEAACQMAVRRADLADRYGDDVNDR